MQAIIMDKISIERIVTLHPSIIKAEQDHLAANKLLPRRSELGYTGNLGRGMNKNSVVCTRENKRNNRYKSEGWG